MMDAGWTLPEARVFSLEDAVIVVYNPPPEGTEPEPEPPRRSYAEESARMLMSLQPYVRRVLRRTGVPAEDLADVTQGVVLDVLEWWADHCAVATAETLRTGRAYITVVARHAAYRHMQRRRRRTELSEGEAPVLSGMDERRLPDTQKEPSPEEVVLAREARAELIAELDLDALAAATMPPLWRAFYAYTVLGVPVSVIAESERIPEPTVYTRLRLAREDLRAYLQRRRAAKRR